MPPVKEHYENLLTDEELELAKQSFEEDPPQGGEPAAKSDDAPAGGDEAAAAAAQPAPAAKSDDAPAGGDEAAASGEDPPTAAVRDERPELPQAFAPRLQSADVSAIDEQIKQIAQDRTALMKRWRAGEIDDDAYDAQAAALEQSKDKLVESRAIAVSAAQFNEAAGAQAFERDLQTYLGVMEKYEGVPYRSNAMLSREFRAALAAEGKKALDAKEDPSAQDLFERAHKVVTEQMAALGVSLGKKPAAGAKPAVAPAPAPAAPVAAAAAAAPAPKAPRDVPKTLAHLPAAAPSTPVDAYSDLASLEGEELEIAIAKMSPAERRKLEMAD